MRGFRVFKRNKGGSGTLGSDSDPRTTPPDSGADNAARVPSASSWSQSLKHLVLALNGPSDLNVEIYVKDEAVDVDQDEDDKWFLAVASTTLTHGAVTSFLIPVPTDVPILVDRVVQKHDFVEVYVRLLDPGGAGAGDYYVSIIGDYAS